MLELLLGMLEPLLGGDAALCLSGGMGVGGRETADFGELSFILPLPASVSPPRGCLCALGATSALGHPHCCARRGCGGTGTIPPRTGMDFSDF